MQPVNQTGLSAHGRQEHAAQVRGLVVMYPDVTLQNSSWARGVVGMAIRMARRGMATQMVLRCHMAR